MPIPSSMYVYGMGNSYGGAPVSTTRYGQYNYYNTPQTIGNQIGGTGTGTGGAGGGSAASQTGNSDAEAFFKSVMSGDKLPFSPFAKSQMMSQQSDMAAAAEAARNKQLTGMAQAGGASAMDPSFKAAQRANMAARQNQNQRSARDIDVATNQQNFGAQMQAAQALNQNAMTRAAWANQAASGAGGIPFSPWGSGMGGGGGGGSKSTYSAPFGGYHGISGSQAAQMLQGGQWGINPNMMSGMQSLAAGIQAQQNQQARQPWDPYSSSNKWDFNNLSPEEWEYLN